MSQPVQTTAAQRQPQHLQYIDMAYYDIANASERPPLFENHDHAIDNHAGAALDVPAQAQAAQPDHVCTDLTLSHTQV